jgi:DNA-binding transcriptional LysR family regulator
MDLRQLECFLAVADELHFGRAAARLNLAQPTVSESIRRLERELGGTLFDRTTRNVSLTELGTAFQEEARAAYSQVEVAYQNGRRLAERGLDQFLVGYAVDSGPTLLSLVATLQQRCPEVTMTLHAMTTQRQIEALRRRRLHAGLCWEPDLEESLRRLVVGHAEFVAVVPSSHPLAKLESAPIERLAEEPLIGWPRMLNPGLYDRFANAMDGTNRPWSLVGTTIGVDNVAARVLSGHGIGIVPEPMAPARPPEGIRLLPIVGGPTLDRVLLWRRDDASKAARVFSELLQKEMLEQSEHRCQRAV